MRKVLFITHMLERSGAPMVLLHLIDTLLDNGYRADVFSLEDGPLREDLEARNIPVTIIRNPLENYASLKNSSNNMTSWCQTRCLQFCSYL